MKTQRRPTSLPLVLAILAALQFLAAGAVAATQPSANLFVATNGSDAAKCTRGAPCLTFARAYAVAKAGDVVEIASGDYGDQEIGSARTRTGARVVFRP